MEINWTTVIASIIFGMALGIAFTGILMSGHDFQYKDASIMTCNYANNLTDIINIQTDQLTICSGFNYTKLDKLNCDALSK